MGDIQKKPQSGGWPFDTPKQQINPYANPNLPVPGVPTHMVNDPIQAVVRSLTSPPSLQSQVASMPMSGGGGAPASPQPTASFNPTQFAGMLKAGNIDIYHRPRVPNPDGSISTVRSASFDLPPEVARRYGLPPGTAVLLPTVLWNPDGKTGRIVSGREAFQYFMQTGQNLGFFKSHVEADAYSKSLHEQQAKLFNPNPGQTP